jgi:hypothetical protein
VIVPLAFPVAVGANATFTETLCPALKLIGNVGPLVVNVAAEELIVEIFTTVPPVFVTAKLCEAVLPTLTLPMLTVDGLAVSTPAVGAVVPVPLTATAVGALVALLPTVITPFASPAAVGVNVTVKGTLPPGAMSVGNVGPPAANASDDELTDDSVAVVPPVLVTEKV